MAPSRNGGSGRIKNTGMKNILIVDDDPVICSLLKSFLSLKKYHIEYATNGIDAITTVVKGQVKIVIMDMNVHGMNGVELIKRIHGINPALKIIAMSGDTSFDKLPPELKATIPFIAKPFRLQDIEKLIVNLFPGPEVV